jgi:nucleotide-binding universal stress UspA family protein
MNVLQIRHVLCPMDLSPISVNALEWANAIARVRSTELRMLHVVPLREWFLLRSRLWRTRRHDRQVAWRPEQDRS